VATVPHVHTDTFRVVMSEVDVSQIHFTSVLIWMDRAMCHWLAEVGHPFRDLLVDGPGIPIVDCRCRYLARVGIDDLITVRTTVGGVGTSSFRSRHAFSRGHEAVAEGELVHVCVDRATRETIPAPEWLRAAATGD
jgi:acyl-CoA thioester hydrolase